MTYALLDDRWDEHPKYVTLELEHFGLMACALTYCNRHLTDGFLPTKAIKSFGASGIGLEVAVALVASGQWEAAADGYWVVGYLDHNPSREEVEQRKLKHSDARAKAGRAGGVASGKTRRSKREANMSKQTRSKDEANHILLAKQNHNRSRSKTTIVQGFASTSPIESITSGTEANHKANEALSDPIRSDPNKKTRATRGTPAGGFLDLADSDPTSPEVASSVAAAQAQVLANLDALGAAAAPFAVAEGEEP